MRRVLIVVAALMLVSVPANAQGSNVIEQLEVRGYYIAPGADADFEDLERVVSETDGMLYFVVLASDPSAGTDIYATDALEALNVEGTVVVVSPGEVGARSTIYGDAQIDDALDALLDRIDRGYYDGFIAFAEALGPVAVPATSTATEGTVATAAEPASSGGGGGGFIFLIIVLVIVGLIWFAMRRAKRNREEIHGKRIDEIKAEIQAQLSEAANDILELEDDILLSDNEEAKELYYAGSAAYSEFQEKMAAARSFAELDELAEGADMALWQLESAEAILEGKPRPRKPEPRPGYEPPAPPPPPAADQRHPQLPDDLQIRRERRDRRGSRPRQRSSGGLGGLGAAAVILKSLQQGRDPRSDQTRVSSSSRSTGVNVPTLGGGGSSRGSRASAPRSSSKPSPKGRGRKRRR